MAEAYDITFTKSMTPKKVILILVLAAFASFGLGYLVASESNRAPIIIEKYSSPQKAN